MTSIIEIFDRTLLQERRRRVVTQKLDPACDFLLQYVCDDIIDRLCLIKRDFQLALNYGCHTGLLSELLNELAQVGCVVSTDAVLECAQRISFLPVVADEELFPFADESFDLIVSALTLQWVNDLPGTLRQIRQGLRPDGVFVAVTLGGNSLTELRRVFLLAEEELYGGASPRVAPFVDVRDLGHLLQRAGFTLPVTDRDVLKVSYSSPLKLMHDLQQMGAGNVLTNRLRGAPQRRLFDRVNSLYLELYGDENGHVQASFEVIYMMGWAPHPDQQKPLRPGSGAVSLTEVFGDKPSSR